MLVGNLLDMYAELGLWPDVAGMLEEVVQTVAAHADWWRGTWSWTFRRTALVRWISSDGQVFTI